MVVVVVVILHKRNTKHEEKRDRTVLFWARAREGKKLENPGRKKRGQTLPPTTNHHTKTTTK